MPTAQRSKHSLYQRRQKGLVLTPTDIELFRWLWMVRVMTLGQLRRVGYYQPGTGRLSSLDNVRKRLRRLCKGGYLQGDTLLDTRERIYMLGDRSLPALLDHCGIAQQRLHKPRGQETLRQVHHTLMVSECAVRMNESIRGTDIELAELLPLSMPFYDTHTVGNPSKKRHVERFVSQEDLHIPGYSKPFRIRPDLVFGLEKVATNRLFFLEADRGSESPQRIAQKQLAYHHYCQASVPRDLPTRRWQCYGPFCHFRVLFITTTHRRIALLFQHLRSLPGAELFAFTTFEDLKGKSAIFAPIWRTQTGRSRPLLKDTD